MANALYSKGKEALLTSADWSTGNFKVVAVDTAAYTPNLSTDASLADIPAPARIATSGNLSGKTATNGVADANDLAPLSAAVTGPTIEALVIYLDTGTAATSTLIAYIDTATNLPFTPNGGAMNVTWDNGANKIFAL